MPKVVLAGGGSGGHITPMLRCAQALNRLDRDIELHIVSQSGPLIKELMAGKPWQLHYIQAGKWRRYRGQTWFQRLTDFKTWGQNLVDLGKLIMGFFQSLRFLRRVRPGVVFVKGGYVGLPIGVAAWLLGIPLIIHESDAKAGLTNRLLAPLAKVIATGWPLEYYPDWHSKQLVFTGNVVGMDLRHVSLTKAKEFFRLPSSKPVLLVTGGSSGSRVINDAILAHRQELLKTYSIIHITGAGDYERVLAATGSSTHRQQGYRAYSFLAKQIVYAYRLADVVVTRAGANTLAEIMAAAKPAIVVPHRYSPGAHQSSNAAILAEFEAASVIKETELNKKLMHSLKRLHDDEAFRQATLKNLSRLHVPGSAAKLAQAIKDLL